LTASAGYARQIGHRSATLGWRLTVVGRSLMEKTAMLNREREERERLLSRYKGADRELIEDAVADHPGLTVAKAIEMLGAFGGL